MNMDSYIFLLQELWLYLFIFDIKILLSHSLFCLGSNQYCYAMCMLGREDMALYLSLLMNASLDTNDFMINTP